MERARWIASMMLLATFMALAEAVSAPREDERERMVERQIEGRGIVNRSVLAAMRAAPRHAFVPREFTPYAYADRPLPIGYGQTISQPYIVGAMTEELRVKQGDKVLEVGTGSGYQAAVLAEITDEVFTIEIIGDLAKRAEEALSNHGYTTVRTRHGDGFFGWPDEAPFDAIIVTAAADSIPPPLLEQLRPGGRMVIPVGSAFGAQRLLLVTKSGDRIRTRMLMPVRFVPFTRESR